MEVKFEKAFLKAVKKHSSVKKQIEEKVKQIMAHPIEMGEPLKRELRGYYSCPVKKNYIIIYLYCHSCRKKGDEEVVACSDCNENKDETLKFVIVGPHDETYGIK